nr:MAG: hypothetical protein [Microvirus Sku28]
MEFIKLPIGRDFVYHDVLYTKVTETHALSHLSRKRIRFYLFEKVTLSNKQKCYETKDKQLSIFGDY